MSNLKIHHIQGYIQNIYLVENKGKFLMMDGGCSCDVEIVKNYLEKDLEKSIHDLKWVVVTHAHPDHSGGANTFRKKYGIKIAGPKNLNDWYKGVKGIATYWADMLLGYMVAMRKGKGIKNMFFSRKTLLDLELNEGDSLPGFEQWKTLVCPGHTDVDLSLINEKEKIAYVADNMVGTGKKIYRPYPLFSPELYKKSLQKYLDHGIERFLLAHYGEVKIDHERIRYLINTAPHEPRVHRNTLPTILKYLLKSLLRRT